MKKSKKHLSRLSAYLKKEAARLEKLISRVSDVEDSVLIKGVVSHLVARREVALSDLGLVAAAEDAMRKASKSARSKKAAAKKVLKKGAKTRAKAPRKAAPNPKKKAPRKAAAVKGPVRGRKPKVDAPASV